MSGEAAEKSEITHVEYYVDASVKVLHGDCVDVLRTMPDSSVDAVVTDPPYGLEFMGKDWDAPWRETDVNADAGFNGGGIRQTKTLPSFTGSTNPKCLRCKGTRRGRRDGTAKVAVCLCDDGGSFPNHRAVELRAFQDWCETWAVECLRVLRPGGHIIAFGGTRTYHRLGCAIEEAGFEIRDSLAWLYGSGFPKSLNLVDDVGERTGWGTALKPAFEPVVFARKPLIGTVAANVAGHGTGALNINACRVGEPEGKRAAGSKTYTPGGMAGGDPASRELQDAPHDGLGRWPTNVLLDESQAINLDAQSGILTSGAWTGKRNGSKFGDQYGDFQGREDAETPREASSGGASRFFYVAKADQSERVRVDGVAHPTVKPLDIMRWLVRLVTPVGGTVLEPFAGSGTTVEACILEGFQCIAIERETQYLPLIVQRVNRRRDPVAAVAASEADGGLFDLLADVRTTPGKSGPS